MTYLDGNAAAGLLREVFATEMTAASCTCGHCGAVAAVAELHAYVRAPGTVLRCPACGGVVIRIARTRERLRVDVSGLSRLAM